MATKNVHHVTINGIKYDGNIDVQNDYEFLEMLRDLEDNPILYVDLIKKVTGDKYEATKDALRNEDGIVTVDAMSAFFKEFALKVAALKN